MKIQELRKLIKEEIQNVLNEATDFKSFTVLQPGGSWYEVKYGAGKSFIAAGVGKPEMTLIGSTPEEKKVFDEIAQMIGGQVQENDVFGFELSIPATKFEELFNVVNEEIQNVLNEENEFNPASYFSAMDNNDLNSKTFIQNIKKVADSDLSKRSTIINKLKNYVKTNPEAKGKLDTAIKFINS